MKLNRLVASALEQTASLWAPVTSAFGWVHQGATILKNEAQLNSDGVRGRFRGLLGSL